MARLDYPDPTPPAVADVLAHLPDLHLFRMLGHAETAMMPWLSLGGALLTTLTLDPVLRELVILRVAAATGAEYERTSTRRSRPTSACGRRCWQRSEEADSTTTPA